VDVLSDSPTTAGSRPAEASSLPEMPQFCQAPDPAVDLPSPAESHDGMAKVPSRPQAPPRPGAPEEASLVTRLQAGEESAFEELLREHGPRMMAVARRYLSKEADAEDALQDAFLNVYRAIGSFAGESRLGTWLHRVTVNAALMRIRSRSRRPETPLEKDEFRAAEAGISRDWGFSASEALAREEICAAVRSALAGIPEEYRIVVRLRDIEGIDLREISRLLGIGLSTVKSRLQRGRLILREVIGHFAGKNS
jgi:RNA polymerase sigma-70 factor, ECF subfamily